MKPLPCRPLPRRHGFTLVEVLVALTLMAVLAGMAWRGVAGIAGTREDADVRVEQTLRVNTVLAQWEQDLQAVHGDAGVPALTFDGASLRLVRRQAGGVQVVSWSLRERRWQRWAGPVVTRAAALNDSWLSSQQLLGNETAQLSLFDGLASWQVYFYRGNAWSNAQSSDDIVAPVSPVVAPVPTRTQLPTGVRLVLGFERGPDGPAGLAGTLTRDVLLAPQLP